MINNKNKFLKVSQKADLVLQKEKITYYNVVSQSWLIQKSIMTLKIWTKIQAFSTIRNL